MTGNPRYVVTFTVEVTMPRSFVDAEGVPEEALLAKTASYKIQRAVANYSKPIHNKGGIGFSYRLLQEDS